VHKGKLKERHHWWPVCLSARWRGVDGFINVIGADGREFKARPAKVGVIGNGHIIKLGKGRPSPWDVSFEHVFDAADSALPRLVRWLECLDRRWIERPLRRSDRFLVQPVTDEQFAELVESLVSLAVRSPKFRAAAVSLAVHLRGPLCPDERHVLEAMNMRHCQRMIADGCKRGGKLVALYAKEGEFIFGDGFYNSATGVSAPPISPRILVPLTPQIAVLFSRPMAFCVEPRLTTLVVDASEVDALNDVVQTYAKDWLFYRDIRPEIGEHFRVREHRIFTDANNPVDQIARDIPGVGTSARWVQGF
jgi:hypothetical protein